MKPLVQICSHSPTNHGRYIRVGFLVVSHQTKKWDTPLARFGLKPQQLTLRPHTQQKIETY